MKEDNEFFESLVPSSFNPVYRSSMRAIFDKTCDYKDKKYSYLSATQCVHQEALSVEEGHNGVICRKQLRIVELEGMIETQGQNLFHYTNLQLDLEKKFSEAINCIKMINMLGYNPKYDELGNFIGDLRCIKLLDKLGEI